MKSQSRVCMSIEMFLSLFVSCFYPAKSGPRPTRELRSGLPNMGDFRGISSRLSAWVWCGRDVNSWFGRFSS
jgi:hypothetical protein